MQDAYEKRVTGHRRVAAPPLGGERSEPGSRRGETGLWPAGPRLKAQRDLLPVRRSSRAAWAPLDRRPRGGCAQAAIRVWRGRKQQGSFQLLAGEAA